MELLRWCHEFDATMPVLSVVTLSEAFHPSSCIFKAFKAFAWPAVTVFDRAEQ